MNMTLVLAHIQRTVHSKDSQDTEHDNFVPINWHWLWPKIATEMKGARLQHMETLCPKTYLVLPRCRTLPELYAKRSVDVFMKRYGVAGESACANFGKFWH